MATKPHPISTGGHEVAIRVEGVSKSYTTGQIGLVDYDLLSERIATAVRRPFRRNQKAERVARKPPETFWALRDISLELKRGESFGVIGPNGAGKSTLLKILARVTYPSEGRAITYGRVGALLGVGTGFNPQLTGRENVFLNGTILGMRRAEVLRVFDDIVEFSGVERFLDTPVKRYSSGMYGRLAFSVAAHLNPEILLIDEVLAVGDADFRRRCQDKIREVAGQGRTVVVVSHSLGSMAEMCSRAMLLQAGEIKSAGSPQEVIEAYVGRWGSLQEGGTRTIRGAVPRKGRGDILLRVVSIADSRGQPLVAPVARETVRLTLDYEVLRPVERLVMEIGISNPAGERLLTSHSAEFKPPHEVQVGHWTTDVDLVLDLWPGQYFLDVGFHALGVGPLDEVDRAYRMTVVSGAEHVRGSDPWPRPPGMGPARARWNAPAPSSR